MLKLKERFSEAAILANPVSLSSDHLEALEQLVNFVA